MFASAQGLIAVLVLTSCLNGDGEEAQTPQAPSEVIAEVGLKLVRLHYVLPAEVEVVAGSKRLAESRRSLISALARRDAILRDDAMIRTLQATRQDLASDVSELRTRFGSMNNNVRNKNQRLEANQVGAAWTAAQLDLVEVERRLNAMRRNSPGQPKRAQIGAEIDRLTSDFSGRVRELREAIDSAAKQYGELSENAELKAAIADEARRTRTPRKLGPSPTFTSAAKGLKACEAELQRL